MYYFRFIFGILLGMQVSLFAQHQELNEKGLMYRGKIAPASDSTSVLSAFKKGNFNGHFRYFLMHTDNREGLTDYYANATGGGLRYETAKFHGLQLAISGFYVFNLGSSDFSKIDSASGQSNRYELALFDVENPKNTNNLARLEEFYLKYSYKKSSLTFGRQLINTPFINLQDGRMLPTGVEGLWVEYNPREKWKLEGGWLYAIAPRGTVKWHGVGESIGIYPSGVNQVGTKSNYAGHVDSKGVGLLGVSAKVLPSLKVQAWNMLTENVFNSALLQADWQRDIRPGVVLIGGLQVIRQDAVGQGGNADPMKAFFTKGNSAMTFGAKLGCKANGWEASLNYNRIAENGRYLVPREWGRDPFYTFMPRERNEGFGDVHALVAKTNFIHRKKHFSAGLAAGYFQLPDVKNYEMNKYGLPSYVQVNAELRYHFVGYLEGLDAQLLIVGKRNAGNMYQQAKYEINKVNMLLYNLVLNFHF